ncbi:MAG: metal-sensitive transcriptional regulator [Bdellovibrionales bacterium]|nr:metal-sensitive transcriptional regulator [Bdellovibrionales bacterium]
MSAKAIKKRTKALTGDSQNPDHSKDIIRLNRIEGQLNGIRKMIEELRYCPEILTQTRAIKAAIQSMEASILEKHLQHCVRHAFTSGNLREEKAKIKELIDLYRKNT